ncbi:hypothetical protein PTKIN_Ptkin17bG0060200 [Pterospermum kingtungense]
MGEVKLVGSWVSFYVYRVIWAVKLKGVTYEYFGKDLSNKSCLLLESNLIHKKVPVLIHGKKSICESMIILEYLDEVWPNCPLISSDPLDRARTRFWTKFAEDKEASHLSRLRAVTSLWQ